MSIFLFDDVTLSEILAAVLTRCMIKIFRGAGVVTPSKPPTPNSSQLLSTMKKIGKRLKL